MVSGPWCHLKCPGLGSTAGKWMRKKQKTGGGAVQVRDWRKKEGIKKIFCKCPLRRSEKEEENTTLKESLCKSYPHGITCFRLLHILRLVVPMVVSGPWCHLKWPSLAGVPPSTILSTRCKVMATPNRLTFGQEAEHSLEVMDPTPCRWSCH